MTTKNNIPTPPKYTIGVDFSQEQYLKWTEQLEWWIGEKMPNVKDPRTHAENVLEAARYGRKMNGDEWKGVSKDFYTRVLLLAGFDLKSGIGVRDPKKGAPKPGVSRKQLEADLPPIDLTTALTLRTNYIQDLLTKYPHLDTPVYKPKVEELAETIVKSRMISNDFIAARGKQLGELSKIRESLHTQIGELMEFLEISPKQRVTKTLESKNADVGSLIARLESYGEVWKEFEKLDSIRELLQFYKMLKSTRPDGSPQLNDWELWHLTRNRSVKFTCRCGETYELLGGFTPEEIEQALLQAQQVYGFGLQPIDREPSKTQEVIDIASQDMLDEEPDSNDSTTTEEDIRD